MKSKNETSQFVWRITYAHFIAYFLAGIFALIVVDYRNLFAAAEMSLLMRPVSDPIVALGPFLQLFRGVVIALVLLPLRKVFTGSRYGFLKLGLLILGLSLLSTIGPTPGSFDGYIYTIIPAAHQALGYIEAAIYILLFLLFLWIPYRFEKRWINIVFLAAVIILSLLSVMGYLGAKGII